MRVWTAIHSPCRWAPAEWVLTQLVPTEERPTALVVVRRHRPTAGRRSITWSCAGRSSEEDTARDRGRFRPDRLRGLGPPGPRRQSGTPGVGDALRAAAAPSGTVGTFPSGPADLGPSSPRRPWFRRGSRRGGGFGAAGRRTDRRRQRPGAGRGSSLVVDNPGRRPGERPPAPRLSLANQGFGHHR